MRAQPNPAACSAEARDRPARRVGVEHDPAMAVAQSAVSCPSTRMPASPTAVGSPPTLAATTGVPHACASTATSPNDSLCDGTATRSAARYHWASVGPVDRRHEPDEVADAALLGELGERHRVAHAGAAGAAEHGDDEPERRSGRRRSSSAAALTSTSGALSGWIRPTNSRSTASAADAEPRPGPRLRRRGGTRARSTPGSATTDPVGVGVVEVDELGGLARRCWPPGGRRPRRPAPRRSRGPSARAGHRRRGGGS